MPAKKKQIADVERPGKSAPSPTSKPVIITHRPIMKDPMMRETPESTAPALPMHKADKPALKPLTSAPLVTDLVNKAQTAKEPEDEKPEPKPDATAEPVEPKQQPEPVKPDTAEADPEPAPAETPETAPTPKPLLHPKQVELPKEEEVRKRVVTPQPTSTTPTSAPVTPSSKEDPTKAEEERLAAEEARNEALQKLVDDKTYFLPINAVEKRRAKHIVVAGILLCLLLLAAWIDIAMDAGLIKAGGLQPVTHFFSS